MVAGVLVMKDVAELIAANFCAQMSSLFKGQRWWYYSVPFAHPTKEETAFVRNYYKPFTNGNGAYHKPRVAAAIRAAKPLSERLLLRDPLA